MRAVVSSESLRCMREGATLPPFLTSSLWLKNRCMEMNTMETPMKKLMVSWWPNIIADIKPVKMVATVDEYFFRIVSARNTSHGAYLVSEWWV